MSDFWGQMIRWVAGSDMPAGGKLVRFGVDKPRTIAGEAIHISARLLSNEFTPVAGEKIAAVVHSAGHDVARGKLEDSGDTPGLYHAQLPNLPAGSYELSLEGPAIGRLMSADAAASRRPLALDVIAHPQSNIKTSILIVLRMHESPAKAMDSLLTRSIWIYSPITFHARRMSRR